MSHCLECGLQAAKHDQFKSVQTLKFELPEGFNLLTMQADLF